jgi:uncharacterized protein YhaN
MNHPALFFKSIEIRRMPGFPKGDLKIDDLSPGVNIIYGPNASGKTTLGRAIQRLLRPTDRPHGNVSLRTEFELNGIPMSLDYDMGHVKCQKLADGADIDCPKLAPPEIGDRHVLALHDLVSSERDHDLAQNIARELAGGYDVSEASRALGYRDRATGKGKLSKNHQDAKKAYREAMNRQDSLLEQQAMLKQFQTNKQAAREAQIRLGLFEKVNEHVDASEKLEQARRRVEAFPQRIEEITSHDVKELDRLNKLLETAKLRRQSEQKKLIGARNSLTECRLPDEGVAVELVSSLRLKCQRLQNLRDETQRKNEALDETNAELAQAIQAIGTDVTVEQASDIDTASVQELFKFVRQVETTRAEQTTADTLHNWLGHDEHTVDTEPLRDALQLLQRWLAVNGAATPIGRRGRFGFVTAGIATMAFSVLMAFLIHMSWLLLLAVGVGLLAWAFWPTTATDRLAEIQREYESLQVGDLSSWSDDDVRTQIRQLQQRHDRAAIEHEKQMKWSHLGAQVEKLARKQVTLEREKQVWVERLGIDADEVTLSLLAANINRFQQVQQRLATTLQSAETMNQEFGTLLDRINNSLASFGFETVDDPDTISAQVERLSQRQQAHEAAVLVVSDSTNALAQIEDGIADTNSELASLFDRVGLRFDQEPTLRRLAGQRVDYDQAVSEQRIAEAAHESTRTALSEHPELLTLNSEELAREQQQCAELADQLTIFSAEIGAIENAIKTAQQGSDLGVALTQRTICAEALREQREQDYDAVVGNVLADYIDRQERDSELPLILRRARELFARITHGRYELHVQPGDPPEFRAKDTARGVGLSLDELSSGTRLQLLMAVRVAFVERQEQGVKVPLILDETLGNSDERRAQEIIDAALEICRDGRQIFYFTAQHDEVAKWQQFLDSCKDVPHELVDLAEVREFSESERIPAIEYERPLPTPVPSPDGLDWLGYGQELGISRPGPDSEPGDYHLWYLIEDLQTLHGLLENGINKWGQLQTLVSYDRVDGVSAESEIFLRAEATARMLEFTFRTWNIGRGMVVDRKACLDSGSVSGKYIDRLTELAAEHDGDGKAIIQALEDGTVVGFQSKKRISLQEHLIDQGYIDKRDVLTTEQIREDVRLAVYVELENGLIRREQFDVLITLVACEKTSMPN